MPEPTVQPSEVLVSVRAISLNHGEVYRALHQGADGDRISEDFAGFVERSPADSGPAPGDRVVGLAEENAWAERISVPAAQLVRVPDAVGLEQAAALPIAGLTASLCLSKGEPIADRRVLVTGAMGGVGMLAVQLAAGAGARVVAYVRNEGQRNLLRRLGAETVAVGAIEAQAAAPYDLIVGLVGGDLLGQALGWPASRGVCVSAGDAGGATTSFDANRFRMGDGGRFGGTTRYGFFLGEELGRAAPSKHLDTLLSKLAEG